LKTEHIEIIRSQLGVALAAISRYNSGHRDEIDNIGDIFYLKGDSKKKVLALLYMLSLGEEDDAVKRYRKETGLNNVEYNCANLLELYKVPLLTALIYNQPFYAMALNYRGFINAGLAIGEVGGLRLLVRPDEDANNKIRRIWKDTYETDKIAAAPANTGVNKFSEISFE